MPAGPRFDPFRLDGRVALVTGGGGGIGRATCVALACAGAAVAALETDEATLATTVSAVEAAGFQAVALAGDVRREADVRRLFDEAEARVGPVDLLVNTAFAARHDRPDEMSLDDWEFNLEINLTGYFLCAR
ncbi:MAG: SDR family NAD(P)-dependent oxidoreductase, partial [Actinomycetota bacterium]